MKVAAAYIRVSTEDQAEFSPDSQLEKIKLYAQRNRILLPEEFIFSDEGISGRNTKKRPAFNEMIGLAKRKPKPFDVILVWKYSRFARNREDSVVYKSMLRKELNIDVISISEDVGDDKMSVLFEAMIEAMDEYYSINLAEEVKRGMTEKAKRGGAVTKPAFGYKVENGEFVVVPEETEVIRKVFGDYAGGKGLLSVAKSLNAAGIRTHRGNKIENRTVKYWLKNPVYIGKIRWNTDANRPSDGTADTVIISDGTHEPIIDIKTWEAVQKRMREQEGRQYYNPNRTKLSHWLSGVVRCEKCGAVLSNQGGFFGCSNRCRGTCTGVGYIRAEKLEKYVLDTLTGMLPPKVKAEFSQEEPFGRADDGSTLIKMQLRRFEIRLERVKAAYEDGADTLEEYKMNKKTILKEMDNLKKISEENRTKIPERAGEAKPGKICRLTEILHDPDVSNVEKNKAARAVFKEIVKGGEGGKTLKFVFWG